MFAKYKECELLAPGGSVESIKAAVPAGCDAVYVGGTNFSARAGANNLTDEQLFDIIEYLHLRNKRLYLAVNTLIKNSELSKVYDYVSLMYEKGVDAFIIQDLGLLNFLSEHFPNVELHASTQMAVSGSTAINFLQKYSHLNRIVLPRELSLEQIKHIAQNTSVDLECFAHGALCYSYSGQCLMSSMICGRSGNRGRCSQSCRLPYSYNDKKSSYLLSMKELSAIELLPTMIESGITSLKLEGRMRTPAYVGAITAIYRKYLDLAIHTIKEKEETYHVDKKDLALIERIFHRSGFTKAYLTDELNSKMISFHKSSASSNEEAARSVLEHRKETKLDVNAKIELEVGKAAKLELSCIHLGNSVSIHTSSDYIVEVAKTKGLDFEVLKRQVGKSDNEYLKPGNLEVIQKTPAFMPMSAFNELRRNAYRLLIEKLIENNGFPKRNAVNTEKQKENSKDNHDDFVKHEPEYSAYVQNIEQLLTVNKKSFIHRIYLETDELFSFNQQELIQKLEFLCSKLNKKGQELVIALPHICEELDRNLFEIINDLEKSDIAGYLVRNLEELAVLNQVNTKKKIISDYLIYGMNLAAVNWLHKNGISELTLPIELNYNELSYLVKNSPEIEKELVLYGYPVAMVSKQCVKRNHNACDKISSFTYMKDRKNYKFAIKSNCNSCYNVIYNSQKLFLADLFFSKFRLLNIKRYRMDFTDENLDEITKILDNIELYLSHSTSKSVNFKYSRGHINRGID